MGRRKAPQRKTNNMIWLIIGCMARGVAVKEGERRANRLGQLVFILTGPNFIG